jgi:hypothetical protein
MQRGQAVPAIDDTAKLRALDEDSPGDIDDTDSLPAMADGSAKPSRTRTRDSRSSKAANVDRLDWLISVTTTVDKRIEKIEEELRQIRILLAEERVEKRTLGGALSAFLADIRRRSR